MTSPRTNRSHSVPCPSNVSSSRSNQNKQQPQLEGQQQPNPVKLQDTLHAEQQCWMRHVAGNPELSRFRMPDIDQSIIAYKFGQHRPLERLSETDIEQDIRDLASVGIQPDVIQKHYLRKSRPVEDVRNLVDRQTSPLAISALPEPDSEYMRQLTNDFAWEYLRRNHNPRNLPPSNLMAPGQRRPRLDSSSPPPVGSSSRGSGVAAPIRPIQRPIMPRGGPGNMLPSPPNVSPSTRHGHCSGAGSPKTKKTRYRSSDSESL